MRGGRNLASFLCLLRQGRVASFYSASFSSTGAEQNALEFLRRSHLALLIPFGDVLARQPGWR